MVEASLTDQPVPTAGGDVSVSVSCGAAVSLPGDEPVDVIERATDAMSPEPPRVPVERAIASPNLDELRVALSLREVRPYAQPVVDLPTGRVLGYRGTARVGSTRSSVFSTRPISSPWLRRRRSRASWICGSRASSRRCWPSRPATRRCRSTRRCRCGRSPTSGLSSSSRRSPARCSFRPARYGSRSRGRSSTHGRGRCRMRSSRCAMQASRSCSPASTTSSTCSRSKEVSMRCTSRGGLARAAATDAEARVVVSEIVGVAARARRRRRGHGRGQRGDSRRVGRSRLRARIG